MIDEAYIRGLDSDGMDAFINSFASDAYYSSTLDLWIDLEEGGFEAYERKAMANPNNREYYVSTCPVCRCSPGGCVVCDGTGEVNFAEPRFFGDYRREEAKMFSVFEEAFSELAKVVNLAVHSILVNDFDLDTLEREVGAAVNTFLYATSEFYEEGFHTEAANVASGVIGFAYEVEVNGYQDTF